MKKVKLLFIVLAIPFLTFAQSKVSNTQKQATTAIGTSNLMSGDTCKTCKPYPWEIGLPLGANQYFGDVYCPDANALANNNLAYGLFVRRHLSNHFALRGQFIQTELAGSDFIHSTRGHENRGLSFTTPLSELSVLGEYYILKERKYTCDGVFKKSFSPYVYLGLGAAFTNPTVSVAPLSKFPPSQRQLDADKANLQKTALVIPFGVGLKFNIAERWAIGAEVGIRKAFTDYLDGVSEAGRHGVDGTSHQDYYFIGTGMLSYRFGDKDSDKDGVVDRCDLCKNEKGLRKFQGCPDTDGDGIPDKDDACPTQAGPIALRGCPDTDGDGIADKDDLCPTQPGLASLQGCPDRDKDGIADKDDACPDVAGVKALRGCPDADGDGITDKEDACPNEAGPASLNGCPDSDGDGIADKDDDCPKVMGVASAKGCPDKDGDGVEDAKDKCPDVAGLPANDGCPDGFVNGLAPKNGYRSASGCEISEEELQQLNFASTNIEFYAGTNKLKPSSYKALDRVCGVLQRCPDSVLGINVYNDGSGSSTNLRSAKLRACSIYAYFLKKKCITKARMQYQGLGDEDGSSNYTNAQGKKIGSRVEFQLR
jgi:OmpA-OmpF porin, OOP family